MTVADICTRTVVTADIDETIVEAARRMRDRHVGDLVVIDGTRRPVGILTDRDIVVTAVARSPEQIGALRVGDVMTTDIVTALAHEAMDEALARMRRLGIRRLPIVTRDGVLDGILTMDDLLDRLVADLGLMTSLVASGQQREREVRR